RSREDLAAYTKLVREDPTNPLRRDALATLHLLGGRAVEATAEFRESLALNPAPVRSGRGGVPGGGPSRSRARGSAQQSGRDAARLRQNRSGSGGVPA